ncbi:hypothetical protein N7E81_12230 [Reichenbachiella carrageenanivorans]|uniref:Uncharacterized protein n=1 Tax=Reichenbachiella carrageenanivorans TaxID=2979869 RepID=A0ABY6CW33_9BACT|nr:hypothetical protein [Reichenbachiella carrageenanivorans]UXX78126.1 hypothetical protein N7E81_12230 [Reichenbachiella carrageenanivorans]
MAKSTYDMYLLEDSEQPVRLTIFIGQNQQCTTRVLLDEEEIKIVDESFQLELGTNQSLVEKELRIRSVLTDVQTDFDLVSQTVVLSGGEQKKTWAMEQDSKDGESYIFTTVIGFYI